MSIHEKLAAITRDIDKPEESGYLSYQDHHYSTRDDLLDVLRKETIDKGVTMIPNSELVAHREDVNDGETRAVVRVELTFVDTETGDEYTASWLGESSSSDDKSTASAETQALRLLITNLFQLSDGMVEAVHGGNPASDTNQQESGGQVHRDESPEHPVKRMTKRLRELGFSDDQIAGWADYVAAVEGADELRDVDDAKVAKWAAQLEESTDEKVRAKVMKEISDSDNQAA